MTGALRFLVVLTVVWPTSSAEASGWWVDVTPFGGVELGPGEDRTALNVRLDAIARETAGRPFAVTRAKWVTEWGQATFAGGKGTVDNLCIVVSLECFPIPAKPSGAS